MESRVGKLTNEGKGFQIDVNKSKISASIKEENIINEKSRNLFSKNLKVKYDNKWAKMDDAQIKNCNIIIKSSFSLLVILSLIIARFVPIVLVVSIATAIFTFKFDAKKLQEKYRNNEASNNKIQEKNLQSNNIQKDYFETKTDKEKLLFIEEKSDLANDYNRLGNHLEREGRVDEAIENYEKSIELKFDSNYAYDRLAILYREKEDYDNEIRVINEAIDLFDFLEDKTERQDIKLKLERFRTRLDKARKLKSKQNI